MAHVALPWMPIFSSRAVHDSALRPLSVPSGLEMTLGTMNNDSPLVPSGEPSIRARTRWMMLWARSFSPLETRILLPLAATDGVERRQHVAGEGSGLGQDRLDHVRRRLGEARQVGVTTHPENIGEDEKGVRDGCPEGRHGCAVLKRQATRATPVNALFT